MSEPLGFLGFFDFLGFLPREKALSSPPMALTSDDIRHIAKLARLNIRDSEVDKFTRELSSILEYVDMLQEVDTKNVEPTAQVTGLTNGFREDEVIQKDASPEELLETSPLPIVERQIETPSAHG